MEIIYKYDQKTQVIMNYLEGRIAKIVEEYTSIINNPQTLEERTYLSMPGYKERLIKECIIEIYPYQNKLIEIYAKSRPKIIIRK